MKQIVLTSIALLFILFKVSASESWELKNFPDSVRINGIAINSNNEVFIIARYMPDEDDIFSAVGVVYLSNDDGDTWTQLIDSDWFPVINDILIDQEDNIYLSTWYGAGIYKSENNGVNWEGKGLGLSNEVPTFLSINSEGTIYAGQFWGGGIDYSLNGGDEWLPTNYPASSGVKGLGISMTDYIFTDGGFYSTDGGNTWITKNDGLPDHVLINQVCYTYNMDNEIFLGTVEGIYYLSSLNSSWEKVLSTSGYVSDIIVTSDNSIYAGTNEGVFYSSNNGQDWQNINNLFNSTTPSMFCFDKEGYLWATANNAIYKSQEILTGVSESIIDSKKINIYPNPFNDYLLIDLNSSAVKRENISIFIYGTDGKLIKSINNSTNDNIINISLKNLDTGTYIIRVDESGINIKNELIIKK
jgi:photosystem II stability/assembly factor-like uncharacterized protein